MRPDRSRRSWRRQAWRGASLAGYPWKTRAASWMLVTGSRTHRRCVHAPNLLATYAPFALQAVPVQYTAGAVQSCWLCTCQDAAQVLQLSL